MSFVTVDPLDAFADDCGAQMTDVERFCNVGTAVIDNDGFFFSGGSTPNFSAAAISFKYSQTKLSFTFRFKNPGATADTSENTALSVSFSATSLAIMIGALWYFLRPPSRRYTDIRTDRDGWTRLRVPTVLITCSFKAFSHLFGNELQKFLHVRSPIYLL